MADIENTIYTIALEEAQGVDNEQLRAAFPDGVQLEAIVNGVNRLLQKGMLELLQVGTQVRYRAVRSDELARLAGLTTDEQLVYKHIQASKNEGIWVRTLKMKTNLLQGVITRALKTLEQKALIKSVKSVKHPTRKLYMLIDMTPSSDITGGPWYTDQELDTDFINQLAKQCYQFIYANSYPKHNPQAIYPASYTGFKTSSQIKRFISSHNITNVDLSDENIEELLTMLVYDGKIERIAAAFEMDAGKSSSNSKDFMYRALRITDKDSPFTDIPCGRCPVFDKCSESGVITPAKCEYFKRWLSF